MRLNQDGHHGKTARRVTGCEAVILLLMAWATSNLAHAVDEECAEHPLGDSPLLEWILAIDTEAICVYARVAANSNIHEIKAEATVEATPGKVFSVISDYRNYPEFMPYVTVSQIIRSEADTHWIFQQLAFPWPINDRYYTIRLVTDRRLANQGFYRIDWTLANDEVTERKGKGVPISIDNGYWDLQPLDGGTSTRVTYFIHTDPGGALPSWVVNIANQVSAPSIIKAVRKRVVAICTGQTCDHG